MIVSICKLLQFFLYTYYLSSTLGIQQTQGENDAFLCGKKQHIFTYTVVMQN